MDWDLCEIEEGDFPHYMLKEIYEQPETLAQRHARPARPEEATAHFGGLNLSARQLRQVERVILTACGTSYHAALVGEYLFEEFARIPVEVEYASEFRYRNPPIDRNTIVLAITPVGRDGRHAGRPARGKRKGTRRWRIVQRRRQHASPARPTAASTCTPARRSASPAPRRSPPRSRSLTHAGPVPRPARGTSRASTGTAMIDASCARCPT